MLPTHQSRRAVLKTLSAGIAIGAAAVPAAADDDELSSELNGVRSVTRQYRDVETAREDGFEAVSPYVPGMGFHFSDRFPPFGSERADPPVLVYFTNESYNPDPGDEHDPEHDDDLLLGATEWVVPGDREENPPNIFSDEERHRELHVTEAEGWHFEEEEGFTGLHAWIHRGNSAGVFHPTNPNVD